MYPLKLAVCTQGIGNGTEHLVVNSITWGQSMSEGLGCREREFSDQTCPLSLLLQLLRAPMALGAVTNPEMLWEFPAPHLPEISSGFSFWHLDVTGERL